MQRSATSGLVTVMLILVPYPLLPAVQPASPGSRGCNCAAEKAPPDSAVSQNDTTRQFTVVFRSACTSGGGLIRKCSEQANKQLFTA